MPTYVFKCSSCSKELEIIRSISDDTDVFCSNQDCKNSKMEKVIQASSFVLKGRGWAKDGYS